MYKIYGFCYNMKRKLCCLLMHGGSCASFLVTGKNINL